ncbi:MAG: hypothetical protein K2X46_12005 [Roseomonas sp.]|nr:hypothetical protein [Roseomonas sp.]
MTEILAMVLDHVLELVFAVLLFMGRVAIARLAEWLKLRADSEVRAYLSAGLDRAMEYGKAEARRRLGELGPGVAANVQLEAARSYVQDRFPDALKRFGVGSAALDKMLAARLPTPRRIDG